MEEGRSARHASLTTGTEGEGGEGQRPASAAGRAPTSSRGGLSLSSLP
jgi:hypothetical protein